VFQPSAERSSAASASSSSSTEPKPGQPLSPESERLLIDLPPVAGDSPAGVAASEQSDGAAFDSLGDLLPEFTFEVDDVREVLEEAFEWLAEKFDSDHWELTERQSRMLGKPTAQLLTSLYGKLSTLLPEWVARWAESTPGAAAFVVAAVIIVTPKVKKQVSISRARRRTPTPVEGARAAHPPVATIRPTSARPVGVGEVPRVPAMGFQEEGMNRVDLPQ
jgi:hypothetical protein